MVAILVRAIIADSLINRGGDTVVKALDTLAKWFGVPFCYYWMS